MKITDAVKLPVKDVVFIDPGLGGSGWAAWSTISNCHGPIPEIPYGFGVIHGSRAADWKLQCLEIWRLFESLYNMHDWKTLVIEYPSLWEGSAVSHAAASGEESNLSKMYFLIGGLTCIWHRNSVASLPILISPQAWKGQLPKSIVIDRIQKYFPPGVQIPDHAGDALGMGFSLQGLLTR